MASGLTAMEAWAGRWRVQRRTTGWPGFAGTCPSRDPIAADPRDWRTGAGQALMAVVLDALHSTGYAEPIAL
jgi:hypothetical protein